ncbi:MAG: hypothetical protein LUD47_00815 [Clostridia bacterium]|nr:hypothetical protein [Clostridia bacterium]
MTLYESGESNGTVSLSELFNDPGSYGGAVSQLTYDDLVFAMCRGGWPRSVCGLSDKNKLKYPKDLIGEICSSDILRADKSRGRSEIAAAVIKACGEGSWISNRTKAVVSEVTKAVGVSDRTVYDYIEALKRICAIDEIPAWTPRIRPRTAVCSSPGHVLADPSRRRVSGQKY